MSFSDSATRLRIRDEIRSMLGSGDEVVIVDVAEIGFIGARVVESAVICADNEFKVGRTADD